jgi:phage I-like protein
MRCTNLIELASIELDEDNTTAWLQAMPLGDYQHPVHGEIKFTAEVLTEYANGVNERIRTADIDIDYDHKKYGGDASGWVKQAEVREDGLWLLVEWTKTAAQKIRDKAYKYFSPEFVDRWTHPKTGKTYKNVLLGGAITNRPFLRDIATLNLTESQMEEFMLEELRKELGLPDDADEAAVIAAVKASKTSAPATNVAPPAKPAAKPIQPVAVGSAPVQVPVAASETKPSDDPIVKLQEERIAKLELALRLSEVDKLVTALNDPSRKYAIAPVMLDEVKTLMLEAPTKQFSEQIHSLFDRICKDGLVELGERGTQNAGETVSATKAFTDLVDAKKLSDPKLSIGDAMELVATENPAAWEAHRMATTNYGGAA